VCRPQLGGSLRGVERVREQQELIDETGLRRGQHGCLPTSVRMATQKQAARSLSSHGSNCRSESLLVTFRAATLWRPVRSQLAEGKIATEDGQPGGAERTRQRDEERGIAVRSRAVRQDEAIPIRIGRAMQKPSNGYFALRSVQKFSMRVHTHGPLYSMAATISPNFQGRPVPRGYAIHDKRVMAIGVSERYAKKLAIRVVHRCGFTGACAEGVCSFHRIRFAI
jgi:hypothetical protein